MRTFVGVLSLFLCAWTVGDDPDPSEPRSAGPDEEVVIDRVDSEKETFRVVQLVDSLEHPWAVDWLPDGRMLVTERPGSILLVDENGRRPLENVPDVWAKNQGGMLDLRVSPDYEDTGWIYFSYSMKEGETGGTVVSRAQLDGNSLTNVEEIYRQTPFLQPDYHFGSRIVFPADGTMVVALGERGQRRERTVDIPTPSASVGVNVRLNRDGTIPDDNPFVGDDEARDEVYSYGHRNQQGMAVHPESGEIWQHEHGPRGGDELHRIEAGENYGWPASTYGVTYRGGDPIGASPDEVPEHVHPVTYWDPSIAPSGMTVYTGDKFPNWENDLLLGALALQHVRRVSVDGMEATEQEEMLRNELGRIRDVATGPDGYVYVLTDESAGGLYRFEPVE